jgi:hypothetical protein
MNSNRRRILKSAGTFVGLAGIAGLYQNCGDPSLSLSNGQNASGGSPLAAATDWGTYTAAPGLTSINGQRTQEAVTGSELDIFIDFTVATHFSHSDQAAGHEQHMLSIIVGRNRTTFYPLRWRASNPSDTIFAVLVYDRDTGNLVRYHRLNETSSEVNILMMMPETYLTTTRNISVVIHHSARGFIKRDFTMSKNLASPYATMVPIFNAAQPFAGANPLRPYIAGNGEASGGQGNLGLIHYPLLEVLTEDTVRVTLGGTGVNRHPRISETHYIAGAALYDQDGHQVALTTSVSYGETVNFSQIAFPRAALRERGITSLRTVVHDTYNGYLMGFLNIA